MKTTRPGVKRPKCRPAPLVQRDLKLALHPPAVVAVQREQTRGGFSAWVRSLGSKLMRFGLK